MNMLPIEPRGFGKLQSEINRLFDSLGNTDSSGATAGWIPAVDINESGDRFELFVDLPGVEANTVDITLDNGVLTISGERPAPTTEEGERVARHRLERGFGRFHRRFILPETVDAEKVNATSKNGVLEIAIAKQAKAQPRRIEIAA